MDTHRVTLRDEQFLSGRLAVKENALENGKKNEDEKLQSATQRDAARCSAALTQSRDTRVERGQKAGPSGEKQAAGDQGTSGRGGGKLRQTGAKQIIQQMS